jgi:hypothetical protein
VADDSSLAARDSPTVDAPTASVSTQITLSMNTANDCTGQGNKAQEDSNRRPNSRISAPEEDEIDGVLEWY